MVLEHVQRTKFSVVESQLVNLLSNVSAQGHECKRPYDTTEETCPVMNFFEKIRQQENLPMT